MLKVYDSQFFAVLYSKKIVQTKKMAFACNSHKPINNFDKKFNFLLIYPLVEFYPNGIKLKSIKFALSS